MRRMIDLLHSVHRPPQSKTPIRLSAGFRSDLAWWQEFKVEWNGMSFFPDLPVVEMASDASGSWGCGAWHGRSWFQVPWDPRAQALSIVAKELLPIILACNMGPPVVEPPCNMPLRQPSGSSMPSVTHIERQGGGTVTTMHGLRGSAFPLLFVPILHRHSH